MTLSMTTTPNSLASVTMSIRRMLSQNLNDELGILAQPYTPGDSTITLRDVPRRVGPGSILSFQNNTFYAASVTGTSAQIEVIAGYDGAPGQAMETGTPLRVNPRFTDYTLFDQAAQIIDSLSSPQNGLFGTVTERVAGMHTDDYYPIPDSIMDTVLRVVEIRSRNDGSRDWVRNTEWIASLESGDNKHLRIFTDALEHQIVYAVKLQRPTSFDDDLIADCGLTESQVDLPVLGSAAYLMQGQEARRVHQRAQGDPRRAEDVPITGAVTTGRELYRLWRDRVDEEYARLVRAYPVSGKAL